MRTTLTLSVRRGGEDRRVEITAAPTATVADLARRLACEPGQVTLHGRALPPDAVLTEVLTPGAALGLAGGAVDRSPSGSRGPTPVDGPALVTSGGLHASRRLRLLPGETATIGRSRTADLRIPCPTVSPRHATVTTSPSATTVTDLGSRNGVRRPEQAPEPGAVPLPRSGELVLGANRVRHQGGPVDDRLALPPTEPPDGRHTVDRPLLPAEPTEPPPLALPVSPSGLAGYSPFSWAMVVGPLIVGGAMALVLNPLMAVFALLSPLIAIGSWYEARRRARRGQQRDRRRLRAETASFALDLDGRRRAAEDSRRRRHPDPAETVRRALVPARSLWSRRPDHREWLHLRLGTGTVPWTPPVASTGSAGNPPLEVMTVIRAATELREVPVVVAAAEIAVIGLVGPAAVTQAVARALLVDATVHQGPADLGILVDSPAERVWAWSRWLPHHTTTTDHSRHLLVLTDRPGALRPGTVARTALDRDDGPTTVIVLAEQLEQLPDRCDPVIRATDHYGGATLDSPDASRRAEAVLLDGIDPDTAEEVARSLARLRDPEQRDHRMLPSSVRLTDLVAVDDPGEVVRRWRARDPSRLQLILGRRASGDHTVELVQAGPHALVGGTTGSGKSELLRCIVASLALQHPPDAVTFVLVDYKGGSAFDACAELPHTVGLVTDLDGRLGDRAIRSLDAEIRRREQLLRAAGASDLSAYQAVPRVDGTHPPLPRLVVVVDEFAALARELPEVLDALVDVARRGRSLGLHLILATQRPTGVVSEQIRTNTGLRIALRMVDPSDSVDVVGDGSAVDLPAGLPGRAIVQDGTAAHEVQVACVSLPCIDGPVQVRWTDDPADGPPQPAFAPTTATDLDRIVQATTSAWAARVSDGDADPAALRRPWLEPLPPTLTLSDLPVGDGTLHPGRWPLGLLDDPDQQRRNILSWHPDDGPLLVYGMPGSGCTSTLRTLVTSGAARLDPSALHVYVVGSPAEWSEVARLPHVGAIVDPDDAERMGRLVRVLSEGSTADGAAPLVLLVVDGIRPALDALERQGGVPLLDQVLTMLVRPRPRLAVAASADRVGGVPGTLAAVTTRKLCLRLPEPYDYATFGLRPVDIRTLPPGRGFDTSTGLEVHLARASGPAAVAYCGSPTMGPDPLDVLPPVVPQGSLPAPGADPRSGWSMTLGLGDRPRVPVVIDLGPGEHLLVTGPSGSGRSTTLAALAGGTDDLVVTGAPRSPLRTHPRTSHRWQPLELALPALRDGESPPHLLLVDDSDLVDDVDGILARILVGPTRTRIVAAAHHERVRTHYGHWTGPLTTGRLGLALQPRPSDAELWATTFPDASVSGWPPGRGLLVEHGRPHVVQVARP